MDTQQLTTGSAPSASQVEQAIARGIAYLHEHQYPNGEFCCYMAPDKPMQQWCVTDSTVFPTAVICNTVLGLADHPKVDALLTRAVPFFLYQMMHDSVWNYYPRWNPLFKLNPPDIDDTAYVGTLFDTRGIAYARDRTRSFLLANRHEQGVCTPG